MKDIRPRAEERARRRQEEAQRPTGTGFMSERTRAKEALRVQVNTYTGENVRKIAATAAVAQEERILRVAAYCRVSTDDIDQLVSIEMPTLFPFLVMTDRYGESFSLTHMNELMTMDTTYIISPTP